jgi:hypothetical protein
MESERKGSTAYTRHQWMAMRMRLRVTYMVLEDKHNRREEGRAKQGTMTIIKKLETPEKGRKGGETGKIPNSQSEETEAARE